MTDKILDWDLATKVAGNRETATEIFHMFKRSLSAEKKNIETAYADSELALQDATHKVHGALSYCGLPRLKHAACQLETALKKGESDKIKALYESLMQEMDAAAEVLLSEIED
tara:strand:+ start:11425 stop:11763 length:339 start_codon:yes stop_codon:yes gene_type:complete